MLTIRFYQAARRIKEAQQQTTKPNPPKDGDGKPRVLASSENPRKTSRRIQDHRAASNGGYAIQTNTIQPLLAVSLACIADRPPHAVVIPVGKGLELAFVASVGCDDIPSDSVVNRTGQGAVSKLGNATESNMPIRFNHEPL